jgi:hypothetical protein
MAYDIIKKYGVAAQGRFGKRRVSGNGSVKLNKFM